MIFCQIGDGKAHAQVVYQDEEVLAFDDINPKAPTHEVIIPKRHIATLNDLAPGDAELVGRLHLFGDVGHRRLPGATPSPATGW